MKGFAICRVAGGQPDIDPAAVRGWVLCDIVGNWGAYLFAGTQAQLQALNALPHVYGICLVSEAGGVRWAELDGTIPGAVRTRLNTWLTARGYPTIPAGWTYKAVILAIFRRLNANFDLDHFDITDNQA